MAGHRLGCRCRHIADGEEHGGSIERVAGSQVHLPAVTPAGNHVFHLCGDDAHRDARDAEGFDSFAPPLAQELSEDDPGQEEAAELVPVDLRPVTLEPARRARVTGIEEHVLPARAVGDQPRDEAEAGRISLGDAVVEQQRRAHRGSVRRPAAGLPRTVDQHDLEPLRARPVRPGQPHQLGHPQQDAQTGRTATDENQPRYRWLVWTVENRNPHLSPFWPVVSRRGMDSKLLDLRRVSSRTGQAPGNSHPRSAGGSESPREGALC